MFIAVFWGTVGKWIHDILLHPLSPVSSSTPLYLPFLEWYYLFSENWGRRDTQHLKKCSGPRRCTLHETCPRGTVGQTKGNYRWVTSTEMPVTFFLTQVRQHFSLALCKEQSWCLLLKNLRGTGASDTVIHQMPVLESFLLLCSQVSSIEVISREANKKYWNTQKIPERLKDWLFQENNCGWMVFLQWRGVLVRKVTHVWSQPLYFISHLDTL